METKKIIVIAPEGASKCSEYLTDGKEYEAYNVDEFSFRMIDDEGEKLYCSFKDSAHLNGNNWIIKK